MSSLDRRRCTTKAFAGMSGDCVIRKSPSPWTSLHLASSPPSDVQKTIAVKAARGTPSNADVMQLCVCE